MADSSEGRKTRPLSASQVRQELSGESAELVLGQCRALWPDWDANGCSLLRVRRLGLRALQNKSHL